MSNNSNNCWVATYKTVPDNDGNGNPQPSYGAVIVDFTDTPGSGPLGAADRVAVAIENQEWLSSVTVLTFVFLNGLVNWNDSLIIVGDQEVDIDDLKLVVLDTTAD